MKKINSEELTVTFNTLAQKNQGKTFTGKEIDELLIKNGINIYLVGELKRMNALDSYRVGQSKLFNFRKDPLYKGKMETAINSVRKRWAKSQGKEEAPLSDEEKAIALLKKQGYQMRVCRGFDLERFKRDNPDLYETYLVYEEI